MACAAQRVARAYPGTCFGRSRSYAYAQSRSRSPIALTPCWGIIGSPHPSLGDTRAKCTGARLPDARRGAGEPQEPDAKRRARRTTRTRDAPAPALAPAPRELARFATAKSGWDVMPRPRDRVHATPRPPTRPEPPYAPRSAAGARRWVLTIAVYRHVHPTQLRDTAQIWWCGVECLASARFGEILSIFKLTKIHKELPWSWCAALGKLKSPKSSVGKRLYEAWRRAVGRGPAHTGAGAQVEANN
jgi:hypothetical protein